MNCVCISGTIGKAGPAMSYSKNMKPLTTFELIVPNEESPGYYSKESVLIVGSQAEPLLERLEAGDEVELSGKLQRGQVVCFKVTVKTSAPQTHEAAPAYQTDGSAEIVEPAHSQVAKPRKPRLAKHLKQPWVASRLEALEN